MRLSYRRWTNVTCDATDDSVLRSGSSQWPRTEHRRSPVARCGHPRRRAVPLSSLVVVTLLVWGWITPPLAAQIISSRPQQGEVTNIFLPAPRALRQQLTRAREALDEQRYGAAVDLLGQLLASSDAASDDITEEGEQDYFLRGSTRPGTQLSLKTEANRLLGAIPEEGRALYELKFGADARQLLDEALNSRDFRVLVEVTRRYFHTDAGYAATMLLGRHYLDRGRALAAAMQFQRLERSDHARRAYDPELSVLLATCWLMADMPHRARETLLELKSRAPAATLRAGERELALFDPNDPTLQGPKRATGGDSEAAATAADSIGGLLAWLTDVTGPAVSARGQETTDWTMYRGNAARNAESAAGTPLLSPRWRIQAANHPNDEELIRQGRKQYLEQGVPVIPALNPLAVDDVILMRTPRRLIGVDFNTGKRRWVFPWYESPDEKSLKEDRIRPGAEGQQQRILELGRRIWDDALYGRLSSDGERVFMLWGLDSGGARQRVIIQRLGIQRAQQADSTNTNKLVALDLTSEGKLQWIVGDEDGTDEPDLAGAFFLGPPLPLMGQLYALAEINGEIRLVVLDAETGGMQWSQQLAHIDARNIMSDPTRRAAGASPSYSDGVLVCPTSSGAVVAVDVSNRSLLWGYQYPLAESTNRPHSTILRRHLNPVGQRWADATATISDGRVLVTPVESEQLYCLDLISGEPVWEPLDRGDLLFTACVHDGNAIMVGADSVRAISLEDGNTQWTCELGADLPSGRGLLAADQYYLPTTGARLLKIDLTSGKIAEDIETDTVLGNLVAYKDQIISQNVDWLATYYQTEPLRGLIAKRLEDDPKDSWALARKAELLLHDGKHNDALEVFHQAYELNPDDDGIRASLVRSLLAALRDDFPAHRHLATELEDLIDQPEEHATFCRWMAVGLKQQGEYEKAMEYFVRLASLETGGEFGEDSDADSAMVRIDNQLKIHRDRWLSVQMQQLLSDVEGEPAIAIDRMIRAHLEEVLGRDSLNVLKQFVARFGSFSAGSEARMTLARKLSEKGFLLQAEMELMELEDARDPATAATATAMLAQMMLDNGKWEEAAMCAQRLEDEWGDVTTLEGPTGKQLASSLMAHEGLSTWTGKRAPWPRGKCEISRHDQRARSSHTRIHPIEMKEVQGPFPRYHQLVYNQNRRCLILTDATGKTVEQVMLGKQNDLRVTNLAAGRASARGHLLMVNVGFEVVAIDTLGGGATQKDVVLWRHDLSGHLMMASNRTYRTMPKEITRKWGPPRVVRTDSSQRPVGMSGPITRHGVIYQKMQDLICAHPLTGQTLWVRSGLEPGSDIFGDHDYTFVVGPEADEATVFKTADGTAVAQRPVTSRAQRWITVGRNVITCQSDGRSLAIRCFDAWQQEDLWNRSFDDDAQCWRPSRDTVAIFEPQGKFLILDLISGKPRVECGLQPLPSLNRLYVLADPNSYTVVASGDNPNKHATNTRIYGSIGGTLCPEINGHIYSIDRQTGTPRWSKPAQVYEYSLPLNQAPESPALVFLQNKRSQVSPNSPRATYEASLLVIDKRDGRKLYAADGLDRVLSYSVESTRQEQRVVVQTNKNEFELTFTDEPVQSAAPFQMNMEETTGTKVRKNAGRIADAILDAIIKNRKKPHQEQKKERERQENTPPPAAPK